jgi:wyosine [tRNA(Phe)-imidazoG37] synthetase (radical SAM superfamily)
MAHSPEFLGCLETLLNTKLEELNMSRNETRTVLETLVVGGVSVQQVEVAYDYKPWSKLGDAEVQRCSYKTIEVVSREGADDMEQLNDTRIVLEALTLMTELEFAGDSLESLVETLEETASELAEELEIHFIYERDGSKREYTPRSLWQPSGGCEWEESASEYDYGWDL